MNNTTSTPLGDLQHLPTSELSPHPGNPRTSVRSEVVDRIRAQIEAEGLIRPEYALLVRPDGDGYQIVSGHHRYEAAKQAGIDRVPAWVRNLDDDAAYYELVLANTQSELTPLEVGIHAYHAISRQKGGRGKKGGLSEYARRVGITKQHAAELRDAAEVYLSAKPSARADSLSSKTKHLSMIHRAEARSWPRLVETLAEADWSVDETRAWVKKLGELEIPELWERTFLPYETVATELLGGRELSPQTVSALAKAAEATVAAIDAETDAPSEDRERVKAGFLDWLRVGIGNESWSLRAIHARQRELMNKLQSSAQVVADSWLLGDWREHVEALSNGSVNLLLTDPPYGIDLQGHKRRSDARGEEAPTIHNDGHDDAMTEIAAMLEAFDQKLCSDAHLLVFCHWRREPEVREVLANAGFNLQSLIVWAKDNHGVGDLQRAFAPKHELILYATKGDPRLAHREPDVIEAPRVSSERHPTEKPCVLLERLIKAVTVEGDLVVDPFGGVASTLVAARDSRRKYWGCELEENYHQIGQRRLRS